MGKNASGKPQDNVKGPASDRKDQQGANAAEADGGTGRFVAIARVLRPQGRKGEVLAEILTDFPSRFERLQRAFLEEPGHQPRVATVEHAWLHKGKVVLKFDGAGSIDDAETLRGRLVLVPDAEKAALAADQYYLWQLEGCQVVAERAGAMTPLGIVTEVERTGGADLLHVVEGSREILIPFARAICKVIDPESRLIVIDPPEDLLDLNRE